MVKSGDAEKTKQSILNHVRKVFAKGGYDLLTIRKLAKKVGIAPSVVYYYFKDKDTLLKKMYESTNRRLGKERTKLPQPKSAYDMLEQRIEFQLDHAEEVMAVLKYYFTFRKSFPKVESGYLPEKAYLHIYEVLEYGKKSGEFQIEDLQKDAKVITHMINGFVMEYYPEKPKGKERKQIIKTISDFIYRAL